MAKNRVTVELEVVFWPTSGRWKRRPSGNLFFRSSKLPASEPIDAWEARREFLRCGTEDELFQWLQPLGMFDDSFDGCSFAMLSTIQSIYFKLLGAEQNRWKRMLSREPRATAALGRILQSRMSGLPAQLQIVDGINIVVVQAKTVLELLAVTLIADKMADRKYARCAFRNCTRDLYFKITSGHRRLYCTHECARADGQRRRRAG